MVNFVLWIFYHIKKKNKNKHLTDEKNEVWEMRLFISGELTSKHLCKPVSVKFPTMSLPAPGNGKFHSTLSLSRSLAA